MRIFSPNHSGNPGSTRDVAGNDEKSRDSAQTTGSIERALSKSDARIQCVVESAHKRSPSRNDFCSMHLFDRELFRVPGSELQKRDRISGRLPVGGIGAGDK